MNPLPTTASAFPAIIPGWSSADSPEFGVPRVEPTWLRVLPGSMLTQGTSDVLVWSR